MAMAMAMVISMAMVMSMAMAMAMVMAMAMAMVMALRTGEVMKFQKGDVLIDRKSLKSFPVQGVGDGHIYLELSHRLVKRAIGQIMKYQNRFIHLRVGQRLDKDFAFYDPRTDRMIILKSGTVFLGEV
jgi:hypothetical protein